MNLMPRKAVLQALLERRSVSAKRLAAPGPTDDQLRLLVEAALTAPDHGRLTPWRFIAIAPEARRALAEQFVAAAQRAEPDKPKAWDKARDKALNAPTLLAVVARLAPGHPKIPLSEQYLSVGAAMENILLAAAALGFGAIMLSGERARDPLFCAALGIHPPEELMGFISIGTVTEKPKTPPRPPLPEHFSVWTGPQP